MSILSTVVGAVTKAAGELKKHSSSSPKKKTSTSNQTNSDEFNAWREDNPDIFISSQDESLALTNPDFAATLMRTKENYYESDAIGDEEGKSTSREELEASRQKHGGYSGGIDGSQAIYGTPGVQPAGISSGVVSGNPASVNDAMLMAAYGNNQAYTNQAKIYEKKLNENKRLAKQQIGAAVRQGTRQLYAQKKDIERAYKDSARQAYIGYMQNKRDIPQQLRTVGITGGAAESTLLGAQTAYQNQLQKTELAKNQAIADIDLAVENLRASGDMQTAQYILNNAEKIAESYLQAGMNDIARNDALALQEAQLTGMYNGQKTLAFQQAEYNKDYSEAEIWRNFEGMREHGWTDEQIQSANARYAPKVYRSYSGSSSGSDKGVDKKEEGVYVNTNAVWYLYKNLAANINSGISEEKIQERLQIAKKSLNEVEYYLLENMLTAERDEGA